MGRSKKHKNNDFVENNGPKVDKKAKRGSKRRVSERLNSIKSLEDAESLEELEEFDTILED